MYKWINSMMIILVCAISITAGFEPAVSASNDGLPETQPQAFIQTGTPLLNVVALSAGGGHTCSLLNDGTIRCWGENEYGQLGNNTTKDSSLPVVVSGLSNGVGVAAGASHTCAVSNDGTVHCWGYNWWGQLGNGSYDDSRIPVPVSNLNNGIAVIAGGSHTCALLSNDTVRCWGYNGYGQLGNSSSSNYSNIPVEVTDLDDVALLAAGSLHTCAVLNNGNVRCWGYNGDGQLGNGTNSNSNIPVDVINLEDVTTLAAGSSHTCAALIDGTVKCWGNNGGGQLGNGTYSSSNTPIEVSELTNVVALSAGDSHTCALLDNGTVKCWGQNYYGQLGTGTRTHSLLPVPVVGLSNVTALVSGQFHNCALMSDTSVMCWGNNQSTQLAEGSNIFRSTAGEVSGLTENMIGLTGGGSHTCGVTSVGKVKCWGRNLYGQLGDATNYNSNNPVEVLSLASPQISLEGVITLSAGQNHTCALMNNGWVRCWGSNGSGQLGDGTYNHSNFASARVNLGSGVPTDLAGGFNHTCALLGDGTVWCWGSNAYGQLGEETFTRNTPIKVRDLSNVTGITAGDNHNCAVLNDGSVKCWGRNNQGQLGDGTTTDRFLPMAVSGLSNAIAVAAGSSHTCALLQDGTIKCWGANQRGQLGEGSNTSSNIPVLVNGLNGIVSLTAGANHTCAVSNEGSLKCWGDNSNAQLGDGTFTNHNTPVEVIGLSGGVSAVAGGGQHTCVLLNIGKIKCMGNDQYGQLGWGRPLIASQPVQVVELRSPHLSMNYTDGQPGSVFTLTGSDFPPDSQAVVRVNNHVLSDNLSISQTGDFIIFLDTTGTATGNYEVNVSVNPTAVINFVLDSSRPLRVIEGGGTIFNLPKMIYLPLVRR